MNTRISRETMMMEIAHIAAKRSTCGRLAVGAVIARQSRPISLGYAGPPSGQPHCGESGAGCNLSLPCTRTDHAEHNAIKFAQDHGIDIAGCDLFTTDSPCVKCAEEIIKARIHTVHFDRNYRDTIPVIMLRDSGILVYRVLANGMMRRVG